MPTTPLWNATKGHRKSKKTPGPTVTRKRPIDRVAHAPDEAHPIDAAIERRFPERSLRAQIEKATSRLVTVLGPDQKIWRQLEAVLDELKCRREEAYFDLGFEHGFAAGRSSATKAAPRIRDVVARLRDLAIQQTSVDDALTVVLDVALALAVRPAPRAATRQA